MEIEKNNAVEFDINITCNEIASEVRRKIREANQSDLTQFGSKSMHHSTKAFTSTIAEARLTDHLKSRRLFKLPDSYAPNISYLFSALDRELMLKRSTPKNKLWFDNSYVKGDTPPEEHISSYCIDQKSPQTCERCLSQKFPVLTVNFPNCLHTLVRLFKKSADETFNDARSSNGRFILNGYAGEGKSTWLNWLTSAGQDYLWKQKLINLKIPASNGKLLTQYEHAVVGYGNEDSSGHHFQKIIWNMVSTKFMRIFFKHYYTQETVLFTAHDFSYLVDGDKKISIDEIQANDHHYRTYRITFLRGPMSISERDNYVAKSPDNTDWARTINGLFEKSQSTLSDEQIQQINQAVDNIRSDVGDSVIATDWNPHVEHGNDPESYPKTRYLGVHQLISDTVAKKLLEMGYRFLVIFDGVDHHHSDKNEQEQFYPFVKACLQAMGDLGNSSFKPAMLIATRNETLDRIKLQGLSPKQISGNFQQLSIARSDFRAIIEQRIRNVTLKGEYNEVYNGGIINLLDRYLDNVFSEYLERRDYEMIALEQHVSLSELKKSGFMVLEYLFRKNHRHALSFTVQLLHEIHLKVIEQGGYTPFKGQEKRNAQDARRDLETAFNIISSRQYLFWVTLFARDRYVYTEYYEHYIGKKYTDEYTGKTSYWADRKTRTFPMDKAFKNTDRAFGTIPNIFSFINLAKSEKKAAPDLRNKLGIKVRIMQILEMNNSPCRDFANQFDILFDIPWDEVLWEIEDLILMGLLTDADRGQEQFGSLETLLENFTIKPTLFWQVYKKFMFKLHVLDHLLPDTLIPKEKFLINPEYVNFIWVTSRAGGSYHMADALLSRCVALITLLIYMSEHEIELLGNLRKVLNDNGKAKIMRTLTNDRNFLPQKLTTFGTHCENILEQIEKFSGVCRISITSPGIGETVLKDLKHYLRVLKSN